jgi:hypothetical protein
MVLRLEAFTFYWNSMIDNVCASELRASVLIGSSIISLLILFMRCACSFLCTSKDVRG